MPEQKTISGWERFVLWLVVTILIAGWWGVLSVIFHAEANGWLVCFATLNIVLTLRWLAARMEKRSSPFRHVFSVVARITAAWFPPALGSLIPLIFVSGPVSVIAASTHRRGLPGDPAYHVWLNYALFVAGGAFLVALLSLYLKRRKLLPKPEIC